MKRTYINNWALVFDLVCLVAFGTLMVVAVVDDDYLEAIFWLLALHLGSPYCLTQNRRKDRP